MVLLGALNCTDLSGAHLAYVFANGVGIPRLPNAAQTSCRVTRSYAWVKLVLTKCISLRHSIGFTTRAITLLASSDGCNVALKPIVDGFVRETHGNINLRRIRRANLWVTAYNVAGRRSANMLRAARVESRPFCLPIPDQSVEELGHGRLGLKRLSQHGFGNKPVGPWEFTRPASPLKIIRLIGDIDLFFDGRDPLLLDVRSGCRGLDRASGFPPLPHTPKPRNTLSRWLLPLPLCKLPCFENLERKLASLLVLSRRPTDSNKATDLGLNWHL